MNKNSQNKIKLVKIEQNNKEATLRIKQRRKIFRKIPGLQRKIRASYFSR
jgi:hypothetical protein